MFQLFVIFGLIFLIALFLVRDFEKMMELFYYKKYSSEFHRKLIEIYEPQRLLLNQERARNSDLLNELLSMRAISKTLARQLASVDMVLKKVG